MNIGCFQLSSSSHPIIKGPKPCSDWSTVTINNVHYCDLHPGLLIDKATAPVAASAILFRSCLFVSGFPSLSWSCIQHDIQGSIPAQPPHLRRSFITTVTTEASKIPIASSSFFGFYIYFRFSPASTASASSSGSARSCRRTSIAECAS